MSESELANEPSASTHLPNTCLESCQGLAASGAWRRRRGFWSANHRPFDVIIVGGGIQGACIYHQLVREGRRVLLVDRGDFGGGTSQASAMLVWGGLLYLKNFDLASVAQLCSARDRLIAHHAKHVGIQRLTFLFGKRPYRRPCAVHAALRLYWMLALGRRRMPGRSEHFLERAFLQDASVERRLSFEEGQLRLSDAQFVFDWIESVEGPANRGMAQNYCQAVDGHFDAGSGHWKLNIRDTLGKGAIGLTARSIVNAAGVWVDGVNVSFGIESEWRHLLAKGASMTFQRLKHHSGVLVFDDVGQREGMSLVPCGNVSLWGSTEELVHSPDDGWQARAADVEFLLESLNRHMAVALRPQDIVGLRCGIRPLAVRRGQTTGDPLALSKRWRLCRDPHRPWISVYGGKLTACQTVARRTAEMLRPDLGKPAPEENVGSNCDDEPEMTWLASLHAPSAQWCVEHRMCWTLDDYLRRRTNIAQWVPRGGLGQEDEHVTQLTDAAQAFASAEESAADLVLNYRRRIAREHDRVLGIYPGNGGIA